jgi:gluconate 2-dehydrogenase
MRRGWTGRRIRAILAALFPPDQPRRNAMSKNVFVFSRLSPEHQQRLSRNFNVTLLDPAGDIDAQYAAALPAAHGLLGVGRPFGRAQLAQAEQLEVVSTISVGYDN